VQTGIVRVFGIVNGSARKTAYLKILRYALLTVAAVSGIVVAIRALLGPFMVPIKVITPLNPEGWFGLALVLMMLVTADAAENTATGRDPTI
jgi:hypothetical protein